MWKHTINCCIPPVLLVTDTIIEMGKLFWKGSQFSLVCYAYPAWESPTDFLPELYYGNVNRSLKERDGFHKKTVKELVSVYMQGTGTKDLCNLGL